MSYDENDFPEGFDEDFDDGFGDDFSMDNDEIDIQIPIPLLDENLLDGLDDEWNLGRYSRYASQMAKRIKAMYDALIEAGFSEDMAFKIASRIGPYPGP